MSFDDLIPFIAFIAYIGFVVFKKILGKKKEPLKAKPEKKVSFGFSKLIGTIKSELEKAANEAKLKEKQVSSSSQKNIWDELKEENIENENFEVEIKTQVQKIVSQEPEQDDTLFDMVEKPTELVDDPIFVDSQKHSHRIFQPKYSVIKRKRQRQKNGWHLSSSKLKQAVVLSEILAKPIGLRDE